MQDQYSTEPAKENGLRQGDVICQFSPESPSDRSWYFVLTADCDLENNKTDGLVTCLRIITARSYLERVVAPQILANESEQIQKKLVGLIEQYDRAAGATGSKIADSSVKRWIQEADCEGIADALHVDPRKRSEFIKVATEYKACCAVESASELDRLVALWEAKNKSKTALVKSLVTSMTKQHGLDYFFLPTVPDAPGVGYFIRFREIHSIEPDVISLEQYSARTYLRSRAEYFRCGRFADYIRFAVAQRAMSVFSRIGMEREFEADRDTAAELVAESVAELLSGKGY